MEPSRQSEVDHGRSLGAAIISVVVIVILIAVVAVVIFLRQQGNILAQVEVLRNGRRYDCWIEQRGGFVHACAREVRTNGWSEEGLLGEVEDDSPNEPPVSIQVSDNTVHYKYGETVVEIDTPGP